MRIAAGNQPPYMSEGDANKPGIAARETGRDPHLSLVEHLDQRVHFLPGIIQEDPQIVTVVGQNAAAAAVGYNGGLKI